MQDAQQQCQLCHGCLFPLLFASKRSGKRKKEERRKILTASPEGKRETSLATSLGGTAPGSFFFFWSEFLFFNFNKSLKAKKNTTNLHPNQSISRRGHLINDQLCQICSDDGGPACKSMPTSRLSGRHLAARPKTAGRTWQSKVRGRGHRTKRV